MDTVARMDGPKPFWSVVSAASDNGDLSGNRPCFWPQHNCNGSVRASAGHFSWTTLVSEGRKMCGGKSIVVIGLGLLVSRSDPADESENVTAYWLFRVAEKKLPSNR